VGGFSTGVFQFELESAKPRYKIHKNCWILMKLPTKHFINTEFLKTKKNVILPVERGVVCLEAALNTIILCTITVIIFSSFQGNSLSNW
jgi:hypothetical protein